MVGGIAVDVAMVFKVTEKAFDGVDFARDGFGGVFLFVEMIFVAVEVFGRDEVNVFDAVFLEGVFDELFDVFAVGENGRAGTILLFEKIDERIMSLPEAGKAIRSDMLVVDSGFCRIHRK